MKCGICGSSERIVFKAGAYYNSLSRDADNNLIPETKEDGTIQTRPMHDMGEINAHKRLEHPEEYRAAEEAKVARKKDKIARVSMEREDTVAVNYAAGKAVAVPVIYHDEYFQRRHPEANGPFMVKLSHESIHTSSEYLRERMSSRGEISRNDHTLLETRRITEEQAEELKRLDAEIDRLKAERTLLGKQIFIDSPMLTDQQVMDVANARDRALFELNNIRDADEKLPAEERVLQGPVAYGALDILDVEIIIEAAMGNHPAAFIAVSEERMADALSAYGY